MCGKGTLIFEACTLWPLCDSLVEEMLFTLLCLSGECQRGSFSSDGGWGDTGKDGQLVYWGGLKKYQRLFARHY